jgi:hypothetical protein
MLLRLLADLTVLVHGAFILFVVGGGFLAWRWRRVAWVHLPCAAWGALIEFAGWICPLTPLEVRVRQQAGAAGYEGGFIEHYLIPLIYPGEWTLGLRLALGGFVVAINVAAYAVYVRKGRHPRGLS